MRSDGNSIRVVFAVLVSMAIHAGLLSMNYGKSHPPVAGAIRKKVTVRLVARKAPEKPAVRVKTPVKAVKKVERVPPVQITEPVEVVVREIPSPVMPAAPVVPENIRTPEPEPVQVNEAAETIPTGKADDKDSPEVIMATPLYRRNPPPEYPAMARRRGLQGTVVLAVSVSGDGRVEDLEISESSGFKVLDHAALKAVRNWLFEPGRKGGKRMAMEVLVPVRFSLK